MGPISEECRKALGKQQRRLVLSWILSIGAIGLFLLVTHLGVHQEGPLISPSLQMKIRVGLWILSLSLIYSLWFWMKKFVTKDAFSREAKKPKYLKFCFERMTPLEEGLLRFVTVYRKHTRITFAYAQSMAIFGLILGWMGPYLLDQYALSLFSVLLHLYLYPSRSRLEGLIKEYEARG